MAALKSWLYINLDPTQWAHSGLSPLNKGILFVVLAGILSAVLESESSLRNSYQNTFYILNVIFAVLFLVEYIVRLWVMGKNPQYSGFAGRLRYARRFASTLGLIAVIGLWVDILLGLQGVYGVMLRLVRVLRIITLARNSEWATAIHLISRAIQKRRHELALSLGLACMIMLFSATMLYLVEGPEQPETFGSIPRALWWAMATLTTVGYGDVYPITAAGKILAGIAAFTSIAIVAMPTGIMAAAFSDALHEFRRKD